MHSRFSSSVTAMLAGAMALMVAVSASAATLILKDGRELVGKIAKVSGVAEDPFATEPLAGEVRVTPIVLVDDGLRRTYVGNTDVRQVLDQADPPQTKIRLWQNVADRGRSLGHVGPALAVDPFDRYGRRIFRTRSTDGPLAIVQGITEITPHYVRVQGLQAGPRSVVWDMRLATSSIPPPELAAMLAEAVPADNYEARLQVVQLYLQAKRYRESRIALEQVVAEFPEREELTGNLRQLRQLAARQVLEEMELRQQAGQHELVQALLERFPAEEVAGETLQQVRQMLFGYEQQQARQELILTRLAETVAAIEEPVHRQRGELFLKEVQTDLSLATLERAAPFFLLSEDASLAPEQKLALAISGWLLGPKDATDNFGTAISLLEVRRLIGEYLHTSEVPRRVALAAEIGDLEGGSIPRVAQIISGMKPPEPLLETTLQGPRLYELQVELPEPAGKVRYWVQLPPGYDPLRRYPTIVALNGAGEGPALALDFWAGGLDEKLGRRGQAMRHGYIVLAVEWQQPKQIDYGYSLREHQAILGALRDAKRRLAIDTDRVFLTGHDIGGNAAWDLALAHPDLWAGVIPFLAQPEKYCSHYRDNARYVDWYFVDGELNAGHIEENATEFDKYLRPSFTATVVEYRGRGHEAYHDEIQRLFDWMNRHQRRLPEEEFEVASMRPTDNFFWWLEVRGLPQKSMVHPESWPPGRGTRAATLRSVRFKNNKLGIYCGAEEVTVWLRPDVIDFDQPCEVELNGRRIGRSDRFLQPDLAVLLEDVRTRGDRQHPYWAKVSNRE